MEAVKEKKRKASVKGAMTVNDGMEVQQAINKMLQTSTGLKGKYVRIFLGNMEILDPLLSPIVKKQNDLVREYVPMDENDQPKRAANGFDFGGDDDKAQKFEAMSAENWSTPMGKFKFLKMSASDFDEMPIDTSKNDSMYLILKYLVED